MDLADAVLPLIKTRSEVWRWHAANAHGSQMHDGVDILEEALGVEDAKTVYDVTNRAIASAYKVIARADDSSGIIGDAVRRLLDLHPKAAALAKPPARKLVDWMIRIQFHDEVDYFNIDPVAYAPALGEEGMDLYRETLAGIAASLGDRPVMSDRWNSPHSHEWFIVGYNEQRLAVLDRDIDRIIETHLGDGKVAAWYQNTAEALAEIGEFDLAIEWAHRATGVSPGHQAEKAAHYWCDLLTEHHPDQVLEARLEVFRRWPTSGNAGALHKAAGKAWPEYEPEVMATLTARPREVVLFAQHYLKDTRLAWKLAGELGLESAGDWSSLVKDYQKIDPLATLPIHRQLVEVTLEMADAKRYRDAARRLVTMRKLAAGTDKAESVDQFIAGLREIHRRRPRLQQEFDRARLP
jgi:tetratricopeptide (TPR) repeat protein